MTDPSKDALQRDADAVERATQLTTDSIRRLLEQQADEDNPLSILAIAEREDLIDEVSRIIPAGNVLSFVLSGIMTSRAREYHATGASPGKSHLNALFKGVSYMRNNMMYQLAFAGPATVLAGYNMLLQLAGAEPEEYLPDGVWQFYVEFGLREDAGRHQTETLAFSRAASAHQASEVDQLAAWLLAAQQFLHDYENLLNQVWEEFYRLIVIEETTGLTGLLRQWQLERPFAAPNAHTNLLDYRQQRFEAFCKHHLAQVSPQQWRQFSQQWYSPAKQDELGRRRRAYIRQLTIHRYLEPGEYSDERYPTPPESRSIAVVHNNNYFIVPLMPGDANTPKTDMRQQAAAILSYDGDSRAMVDTILVNAPRQHQMRLRAALSASQREHLERLRKASIIINWDVAPRDQPLTYIRTGRRGIGDHGLTVFRTDASTVFDFSHIFFDGPWAMATAEILTNEASKYLKLLADHPPQPIHTIKITPLDLQTNPKFLSVASKVNQKINYVSAEYSKPIAPLQQARQALKTRTNIRLTINDLLVLYRTIYGPYYHPSEALKRSLQQVASTQRGSVLVRAIYAMIEQRRNTNPSLFIPIDASRYDPKERLFPSVFRSPLMDFRTEHEQLLHLRDEAIKRKLFGSNRAAVDQFYQERQNYLGSLHAFSEVMQRYRDIATSGQSMGATAIRLIAGLPEAAQKIVDGIPGQLTVVNEAIKGEEVFSNVGQVVSNSSISRFSSAKDDNDKKVMVWGIMTDAQDTLHIALRDFRQPVLDLALEGHPQVAQTITLDFLIGYMEGLYTFVDQMQSLIMTDKRRG